MPRLGFLARYLFSPAARDQLVKELLLRKLRRTMKAQVMIEIRAVGVDAGARGSGIAGSLIGYQCAQIEHSKVMNPMMYTWVSLTNLASIRAFERNYFKLASVRLGLRSPEGLCVRERSSNGPESGGADA